MAANVSPGVYTKIIDLSTYVQEVPSTIGMFVSLATKGRDNKLVFVGGRSDLISEWGEPDISKWGKNYGQGMYEIYNYLGESGATYFMRVLPDDATFSNLRMSVILAVSDATASIELDYKDSLNSLAEIKTSLETVGTKFPLCILRPIGRGEYYNALGLRLTEFANPMVNGVYTLDIYEKQTDGSSVIIESFDVSFDPKALDSNGDSIWISYVLETYSKVLRADMIKADGSYAEGYDYAARVYDKNIGAVSVVLTSGSSTITDNKQDFSQWQTTAGANYDFMVMAMDGKGNKIYGWLGAASGAAYPEVIVHSERIFGSPTHWNGDVSDFDINSEISYEVRKTNADISGAFISSEPAPLKLGSDGSLLTATGDLDSIVASQILVQGYSGLIDDSVLDTENIYFSAVFDAGYPDDVKSAISTLVQTRKDCVALLDNGDSPSYDVAISSRQSKHTFNNYYCALYEEYNKVYDQFTGQDIWVSPIYHMSYLLPRNDSVSEIWYAVAGFNRASIDTIKELRFNPKLGQRDQFYLKQLNPIVQFAQGYTVWGQLTTQAKPSALQDLNIVRLVLYCKRALELYCRFYLFELNDSGTWGEVYSQVVEFLENIKTKRGLYNYSVEVSATEYERKRKTFHVNVTLEPTRVVEKILLNFFIK